MSNQDFQLFKIISRPFGCYDGHVEIIRPAMKYPLHTQSKPVSGIAAKKLLEAIDSGGAVVNDRMLALAKRKSLIRRS